VWRFLARWRRSSGCEIGVDKGDHRADEDRDPVPSEDEADWASEPDVATSDTAPESWSSWSIDSQDQCELPVGSLASANDSFVYWNELEC
jgi:hypothetical protein